MKTGIEKNIKTAKLSLSYLHSGSWCSTIYWWSKILDRTNFSNSYPNGSILKDPICPNCYIKCMIASRSVNLLFSIDRQWDIIPDIE